MRASMNRGENEHVREAIYYEEQSGWGADDYYALFRYLNRMLLNRDGGRAAEIAAIDLDRLSPETAHLLKHMLVLKRAYERVLGEFPNLAGLEQAPELAHPLYLSDTPTYAHPYLTEHGIYL